MLQTVEAWKGVIATRECKKEPAWRFEMNDKDEESKLISDCKR